MIPYYVTEEFHMTLGTKFAGGLISGIRFFYAIRRSHDDSLVFRAVTAKDADELLERLAAPVAA